MPRLKGFGMDKRKSRRLKRRKSSRLVQFGGLAALALMPGLGCGREFFRQWADQDVTEAVFEKSRDPRWRLPMYTIDPPAMSRFADYSDPDRPAAPPDDLATEALSPYPQKPHWRAMVPIEGTGYLDMMDEGRRYVGLKADPKKTMSGTELPPLPGDAPPPPTNAVAPFGRGEPRDLTIPGGGRVNPGGDSGENPGTLPGPLSPNSIDSVIPPPGGSRELTLPPQTRRYDQKRDSQLLATAFQDSASVTGPGGIPNPNQIPTEPRQMERDPTEPGGFAGTDGPVPLVRGGDSTLITRPGAGPEERKAIRAATSGFAALLSSVPIDYNEALIAGLPAESRPYVIGPAEALQLGLVNSRAYQFRLEQIYVQSLTVTLNRFAFTPQFYAGMSPSTGVSAGNPAGVPGTGFPQGGTGTSQFLYQTLIAPGAQRSTLPLNTAAGFGKLFSFGGRFLAAFANTTVFNFIGKNPGQPTVQSGLPITFVQPFLRGGGRAVTLEPLTLAERNLLYEIRSFARFRQLFFVTVLGAAGQAGATLENPGVTDPNIGFLQLLSLFQQAENTRIQVASLERALEIYKVYAEGGASSGISQLQVDQIDQNLNQARGTLITAQIAYRNTLDQYKQQLGIPPDVPLIPDVGLIAPFREGFREILAWQARPNHTPEELPGLVADLPVLENVLLDDRALFDYSDPQHPRPVYADPEKLEEYLLVAERIALENRLDLMNQRATLYDTWRQLAVTANALLPIFNVNMNYQLFTPSGENNPFGFNSRSNQFNLSWNAELPLVRITERNNFRTSIINYQRGRRALMNFEDNVKFQVRSDIRNLIQFTELYQINKTNLIVVLRQRDQALQQIIAPPDQGGGANVANQATQTLSFIQSITSVLGVQNSLITNWVNFQSQRIELYADLGTMPYDEWETYYELYPAAAKRSNSGNRGNGQPDSNPGAPEAREEAP